MNSWQRVSTVMGSVAVLALSMSPAVAAERRFDDPVGDTKVSNDIRWVEVDHGGASGERFVVRVRHAEVHPGDSLKVYVDSRPGNRGPEWRMSAYADSEWVLERVDTWKGAGTLRSCPGRVRLTDGREVARWGTSRDCLNLRERVRVAVRASDFDRDGSDWARAYHRFLGWVQH